MPCSQGKARLLLKQGKAKIVGYKPFTIQLTYATGEAKQEMHVGIDEGARHVGIAITSKNKVLAKGEVELRQDVHSLLTTKQITLCKLEFLCHNNNWQYSVGIHPTTNLYLKGLEQ